MGRAPCCDKSNVKRGPWSPEEDAMLKSFIQENGTGGNWIALPQKIGLKRCGKSCRLRWLNYLRPDIKHGEFSEEEDNIICNLYLSIGSRWSIIAAQLPGRTDNDIKNYWNTRLKKKLLGKRKELHHQTRRINKSENNENANVVEDMKQSCYYPEPTFKMPCSYQELPHDHVSIRKLLISLGGRFLDNQQVNSTLNLQDPLGISTTNHLYSASSTSQLQVHHHTDNSIAGFSYSSSACAPSGSCNTHTLNHDSSGLHFDIGDLVYSNSQGLALFGYPYGEEIITNIPSNAANGNAWVDGTSLVPFELGHPSHVSDCESYQQEIMQECVLNSENHASGECI